MIRYLPLLSLLTGCFVVGPDAWEQRLDADGDGLRDPAFAQPGEGDCDDFDPLVGGPRPLHPDTDGDGFGNPDEVAMRCDRPEGWTEDATDCDDANAAIFPGAVEQCNGVDDDCDELVDSLDPDDLDPAQGRWFYDDDGDGFGEETPWIGCNPTAGYVLATGDCDDADPLRHPNALEICDTLDNDCDGAVDDADSTVIGADVWYRDNDGDGFGVVTDALYACFEPTGYVLESGDCDDTSSQAHPQGFEICDHLDNDCDGLTDDEDEVFGQSSWYLDADGDGWGVGEALGFGCFGLPDQAPDLGDCDPTNPAIHPLTTEIWYDGVDQNCDGLDDFDRDADGHYPIAHGGDDCDDSLPTVYAGATEVWYDGIDQNCDGLDDFDRDRDGHRVPAGGGTDCDDNDPALYLGAALVPTQVSTLELALTVACDDALIEVEAGTYVGHIVLMRPTHLVGLGGPEQTILQGSGASAPVIAIGSQATGSVIEGFTVRGGSDALGGGINATSGGGALSTLTLRDLVVRDNTATNKGGGLAFRNWGHVALTDIEVASNYAPTGGGLSIEDRSTAELLRVQVHDNTADWSGGGIYANISTLIATESDISYNEVTSFDVGGAVHFSGSPRLGEESALTLTDVSMISNRATGLTGALAARSAHIVQLNRVFIADNHAFFTPGVSIDDSSELSIRNGVFVANPGTALKLNLVTTADLAFLTFAGNRGLFSNPVLAVDNSSGTLTDTILAFNEAPGGAALGVNNTSGEVLVTSRIAMFGNTDADTSGTTGIPTWSEDPLFTAFDLNTAWDLWDLRPSGASPYLDVAGDGGELGAWGDGEGSWTP